MKYKIKGKFEELKNVLEVKLRVHRNLIFHFHCACGGHKKGCPWRSKTSLLSRVQTVLRASTPPFVFANLPRALNTQYILKRAN